MSYKIFFVTIAILPCLHKVASYNKIRVHSNTVQLHLNAFNFNKCFVHSHLFRNYSNNYDNGNNLSHIFFSTHIYSHSHRCFCCCFCLCLCPEKSYHQFFFIICMLILLKINIIMKIKIVHKCYALHFIAMDSQLLKIISIYFHYSYH